jgi:hypothetical protein
MNLSQTKALEDLENLTRTGRWWLMPRKPRKAKKPSRAVEQTAVDATATFTSQLLKAIENYQNAVDGGLNANGITVLRKLEAIATENPSACLDDGPTSTLIRQVLGAVEEFTLRKGLTFS